MDCCPGLLVRSVVVGTEEEAEDSTAVVAGFMEAEADFTEEAFRVLRAMAADVLMSAAIVAAPIAVVHTAAAHIAVMGAIAVTGATADGAVAATDGAADGVAGIGAIRVTAVVGDGADSAWVLAGRGGDGVVTRMDIMATGRITTRTLTMTRMLALPAIPVPATGTTLLPRRQIPIQTPDPIVRDPGGHRFRRIPTTQIMRAARPKRGVPMPRFFRWTG